MLLWEEKHHFPEIPILSKIKFRWQLTVKCQFSDVTSSTSKFVLVSDTSGIAKISHFLSILWTMRFTLSSIHSSWSTSKGKVLGTWHHGDPGDFQGERQTDRQTDTHTHTKQQHSRKCAPGRGKFSRLTAGQQQEEGRTSAVWEILEGFMEEVRFLQVDCRHWCKYIARLKSIPSKYGEGWVYIELRVAREQPGKGGSKWAQD